jgi:hypothetical protein
MTMSAEIENNDNNESNSQENESTSSPGNIVDKIIELIGEDNAKKLSDNQLLITTQADISQIVENVGDQLLSSIGGKDTYNKIKDGSLTVVSSEKLQELLSKIQQNSIGLETAKNTISELQSTLKEQKKLIKKFYQLEAVTLGHKQALESLLKCFDTNSGWPTIEVYTEGGWNRGSVNYNLHNAIMLARAATQSENIVVIEKHLSGLNGVIKSLNQDMADMQKLSKVTYNRCKSCQRIKEAGLPCHSCGTSEEVVTNSSGDEDDDD